VADVGLTSENNEKKKAAAASAAAKGGGRDAKLAESIAKQPYAKPVGFGR